MRVRTYEKRLAGKQPFVSQILRFLFDFITDSAVLLILSKIGVNEKQQEMSTRIHRD